MAARTDRVQSHEPGGSSMPRLSHNFAMALLLMASPAFLQAQKVPRSSQPGAKAHHLMYMQYSPGNKLIELGPDGRVVWQHPIPSLAVMFKLLKNGHVMYAYGGNPTGVQEVD